MRVVLSTLGGVLAALVLVFAIESLGHRLWPPPTEIDWTNPESARAGMSLLPLGALVSVAMAWVIATFVGGWVAARFAHRPWPAYIVGGLIVIASVGNLLMLPHPIWFWLFALVIVPVAALGAGRLGYPEGRTSCPASKIDDCLADDPDSRK